MIKYPSKTFFTADTHFDHAGILRHCKRPFADVKEMNEVLMQRWNDMVKPGSTVYIIGDFAFKNHAWFLHRLNGKKILIEGNHDKMSVEVKNLFREVHPFLRRRFNGKDVTLCHYSMNTWASSVHGAWHLYGHSHGRLKEGDSLSFDVGTDMWDYTPVPLELVEYKMKIIEAALEKKYMMDFSHVNAKLNEHIKSTFILGGSK